MGSDGEKSRVSDFDSETVSRLRLILSRFRKIAFFVTGNRPSAGEWTSACLGVMLGRLWAS